MITHFAHKPARGWRCIVRAQEGESSQAVSERWRALALGSALNA